MRTHEERTNRIADLFYEIEPEDDLDPIPADDTDNQQEPHA